jgi:hypothetical protein
MSLLNVGGLRRSSMARIFGFESIRRALQQQKRDQLRGAQNSIAQGNRHGSPHLHQREIERRLRQAARTAGGCFIMLKIITAEERLAEKPSVNVACSRPTAGARPSRRAPCRRDNPVPRPRSRDARAQRRQGRRLRRMARRHGQHPRGSRQGRRPSVGAGARDRLPHRRGRPGRGAGLALRGGHARAI